MQHSLEETQPAFACVLPLCPGTPAGGLLSTGGTASDDAHVVLFLRGLSHSVVVARGPKGPLGVLADQGTLGARAKPWWRPQCPSRGAEFALCGQYLFSLGDTALGVPWAWVETDPVQGHQV